MEILEENRALALRTCAADGRSHGSFLWPTEIGSVVVCDDWRPDPNRGHGLHALLDGIGNFRLLSNDLYAIWQVVEVDRSKCIDLGGKVKFESCILRYSGNMADAMAIIADYQVELSTKTGEYSASCSSIQSSTSQNNTSLVALNEGSRLASSGYQTHLFSSGYCAGLASCASRNFLSTSGDSVRLATSGDFSKLATSGNFSKLASSGEYNRLSSSGIESKLVSSGISNILEASGRQSISVCAGLDGVAFAGEDGCIALAWWDEEKHRYRLKVGYVGEDGIEEDRFYRLDENNNFTEV